MRITLTVNLPLDSYADLYDLDLEGMKDTDKTFLAASALKDGERLAIALSRAILDLEIEAAHDVEFEDDCQEELRILHSVNLLGLGEQIGKRLEAAEAA